MTVPYAPTISYRCDDIECCLDGCPDVNCRVCGQDWPCTDYVLRHTVAQSNAQRRWVVRKRSPHDGQDYWEYCYRDDRIEAQRG